MFDPDGARWSVALVLSTTLLMRVRIISSQAIAA
jgi:hypothetical protein